MAAAGNKAAVTAWLKANRSASKVHTAFGADWEIPDQPPFKLWLWARSTFWDADRSIFTDAKPADIDEAIEILKLEDLVRQWAEYGLSISDVYNEVHAIVLLYLYPQLATDGGDASGEAKAPKTSATSSRSTSRSSRRTGGASTAKASTRKPRQG